MNQYRCETCKNDNCPFGTIAKYATRIIPNIMEKVGCASHSDLQSERYIQCTVCGSEVIHPHCDICFGLAMENHRQEERDKTLDEGIAKIQERIDRIFEAYKGETNENLTRTPYNMANGMGEAQKILKELRAGE